MYKRRRKYYIPVTRSFSSALASLLTQALNQPRKEPDLKDFTIALGIVAGIIIVVTILSVAH